MTDSDFQIGDLVKIVPSNYPSDIVDRWYWSEIEKNFSYYYPEGTWWINRHFIDSKEDGPIGMVISREHMSVIDNSIITETQEMFVPVLFDTIKFIHRQHLRKIETNAL